MSLQAGGHGTHVGLDAQRYQPERWWRRRGEREQKLLSGHHGQELSVRVDAQVRARLPRPRLHVQGCHLLPCHARLE